MVRLHEIRIGDRGRTISGWLILSEGAVRGLLMAGEDGEVLFGLAFDRRIRPADEMMIFRGLPEAQAWLDKRLAPAPPRGRGRIQAKGRTLRRSHNRRFAFLREIG